MTCLAAYMGRVHFWSLEAEEYVGVSALRPGAMIRRSKVAPTCKERSRACMRCRVCDILCHRGFILHTTEGTQHAPAKFN